MFCDANHISISARLRLFIEVCESVQRALVAIDMIAQDAAATVVSDAARGSGSRATRTSCIIFAFHRASARDRHCSSVGLSVGLNMDLNVGLNMGLNWRENRQLLPPSSSSVTRFLLRFVSTSTPG